MPNWIRLSAPAAGAFSATWITRIGALVFALMLGGAFLIQLVFCDGPHRPGITHRARGDRRRSRHAATRPARGRHRTTRPRWTQQRPSGPLPATDTQLTGGHVTPAFNETTGETDGSAPAMIPLTEDEAQLREVLRLEAIERRTRSLRSGPVVITYRRPDTGGLSPAAATAAAEPTAAPVPGADTPAEPGTDNRASTPNPPQPVSLQRHRERPRRPRC